ncbi:MAG TPA: TonB family protein [Pyrinomonadaceae bacterium]|jgi:TonB family C-terminal domain|nr:TonB family protein [Pyrinomonadaceae bacterium]
MFDNLVESSSHKDDISRKGSFVVATAAIYGVLLVAFFVAGIYWYDNHLGEMELELTTLVAPVPVPQQQKEEPKQEAKPVKVEQNVDVRKELIADVTRTELVPKEVSAKASDIPPVRKGVTTVLGSENSSSAAPMPAGPGAGTVVTAPTKVAIADEPPPPAPTPPRAPISGGVLNGKAISLPKPAYPPIARAAHAAGTVVVQVLIDENGNVVSAHAVSGHPLLQAVAVGAARQARFSPTKLSGQPVKVTGVIQYNFVAQ